MTDANQGFFGQQAKPSDRLLNDKIVNINIQAQSTVNKEPQKNLLLGKPDAVKRRFILNKFNLK